MIRCLDDFIPTVQQREARRIAIAIAEDTGTIKLVKLCLELGIAEFVLIGDQPQIDALLKEHNLNDSRINIINKPDHKEAATEAVNQVISGNVQVVMKGNLHTSVFMKAVLNKESGLSNGNLISQVTVYDRMDGNGLQMITDCAMNIEPNLDEKRQIIDNAIDLARRLGYEQPKVAVLTALEAINHTMSDTLDAASLSKMAERGQIRHAVVDGPFALDNILSRDAAAQKGIKSEVAGNADIILAPNLQVGNALHKALTYLAQKKLTTAIIGARVPIVMTSRTDPVDVKLLSIAIATYIS